MSHTYFVNPNTNFDQLPVEHQVQKLGDEYLHHLPRNTILYSLVERVWRQELQMMVAQMCRDAYMVKYSVELFLIESKKHGRFHC